MREISEIRERASESEREEETSEWARRAVYKPVLSTVTVLSPSRIFSLLIDEHRNWDPLWDCVKILRTPSSLIVAHYCTAVNDIQEPSRTIGLHWPVRTKDKYVIDIAIGTSPCVTIRGRVSQSELYAHLWVSAYCLVSLPLTDLVTIIHICKNI